MNAVILACSTLKEFVEAAQKNCGTDYPLYLLDRNDHSEPARMKEKIAKAIDSLPDKVDTVLVAMGFCGGAWDHVSFQKRIVIPRVDDCVSALLQTDDEYCPNRKTPGHLYLFETDPADFSALTLLRDRNLLDEDLKTLDPDFVFEMMFGSWRNMDIIDTGLNDCYSEAYAAAAQEQADRIGAALDYAEGSIRLFEKLVSGKWDHQFIVAEPGVLIRHSSFFP